MIDPIDTNTNNPEVEDVEAKAKVPLPDATTSSSAVVEHDDHARPEDDNSDKKNAAGETRKGVLTELRGHLLTVAHRYLPTRVAKRLPRM